MAITAASARVPAEGGRSLSTALIMPLGDSITELDWEGGYRSYLYKILSDSGADFDFVGTKTTNHDDNNLGFSFPETYWDHEGYNSATITGRTGSAWAWNLHIAEKLAANPPDVVLVLLGTNDLNNGCCSGADIAADMSAFLDGIWSFDPTISVVLGTPPSVDPARYPTLNNRIADYDALLPSLVGDMKAQGRSIALADHHAVMNTTSDLVGDGIHPSPQGYRKMARVWYDAMAAGVVFSATGDGPAGWPGRVTLLQNYPNPFNPVTTIAFSLPERSRVTLRVFNVLGEEIALLADEVRPPGRNTVEWNAGDRPGGIYFYRLAAGTSILTGRMALVR